MSDFQDLTKEEELPSAEVNGEVYNSIAYEVISLIFGFLNPLNV